MDYQPVLTKKDFVRRYAEGEFGNCSPTWNTLEDWLREVPNTRDHFHRKFHIRNQIPGGSTYYNLSVINVFGTWNELRQSGVNESTLYISEMCPTEKTLIQGEVMRSIHGLCLYYSTIAKPMREALKEKSREATGIMASCLLKTYLCPNSLDWLHILLDRYPGHVVEFTTLSTCWGTLPNFNTLFWEVRSY